MQENQVSMKEQMIEKFCRDRYASHSGIEIVELYPGYAKVKMEVKDYHLNAVDTVHGGALFTLGDFACAVAGNCGETTSVAIEANISYLKPTLSGTLFAEAKEILRSKSLIGFEVAITNEKGEQVARFYSRTFIRR